MLKDIFTPEVIQHYKTNKNLITSELLEKLRAQGNEGKDIALEILDTEKSEDNFYLDAFGEKISNNGNRDQKKAFTQMKLSKIHLEEIERCKNDLMYFKDNYVKILTKSGYTFPETRPYQVEFLKDMDGDDENIVSLQGRQCCSADTEITVNNQKITMKDLFDDIENTNSPSLNEKFTESYKCNNKKVLTPLGYKEIEYVHKTIPYEKYRIKTENGFVLECAEKHVLILEDGRECYAKDSLNKNVKTINGISKIIECTDLNRKEAMYDISIKNDTELYFSNGILSHNSGKSITVSIYLAHKFNFGQNMNIGICANKGPLAREFLNNVKNIFEALPMWMRVGVTVWNKGSIESEAKMRILTDVPGPSAFRGFTCAILVIDECAFIRSNVWKEMEDSVFPSQSALGWKKNIIISTPNGVNHFKKIVDGAKNKTNGFKYHFVNWRDVPRYDSKGNILTPEQFKEKTIKKHGEKFFLQNYACSFLGSSLTLPSAETLDKLSNSTKEPEYLRDSRLKIYKEPQKDHIYFLAVDPAKSGEDAFAIQIVDLTSKPFEQVASAQLFKCNFQKMPVFIVEWGEIYNNAFIIVENNEGAGTYISSVLKLSYDYPNLFYEKKKGKIADLEPGFRTTQKTRPQILDILKSFLDNEILILHDAETVSELSTFILKNDKYQADDGCHDDLVMSLALIFAPFCDIKNFDDIEWVISYLYDPEKACKDTSKFYEHFVIGNFDSFDDDSYELSNKMSQYDDSDFGDFSLEDGFDDYYNNY